MDPRPPDEGSTPPIPPPLPAPSSHELHPALPHFKVAEKESGFWKKFQHVRRAFNQASHPGTSTNPLSLLTGPYFFYGTLVDPGMLMEILELKERPILRPAKIVGYSCRLWGQYPSLIDGPGEGIVEGAMYEVEIESHAARLAEYETKAYGTAPCEIRLMDGKQPSEVHGTTFRYAGPNSDLHEGDFDLKTWLRHMGRGDVVDDN